MRLKVLIVVFVFAVLSTAGVEVLRARLALNEVTRACERLSAGMQVTFGVPQDDSFRPTLERATDFAISKCGNEEAGVVDVAAGLVRDVPYHGFCGCGFKLSACTGRVVSVGDVVCNGFE